MGVVAIVVIVVIREVRTVCIDKGLLTSRIWARGRIWGRGDYC